MNGAMVIERASFSQSDQELPATSDYCEQDALVSTGPRFVTVTRQRRKPPANRRFRLVKAEPFHATPPSREIEASITDLVNLPQGWDGYNGRPVLSEVAEHARRLMAAIGECTQLVPDIVPLSDGGLQLEWFVGAYEVEVVIATDGRAHVYFECTNDGRIREFSLDSSFSIERIAPYFRELRR